MTKLFDLRGKVAAVTGGTRGIGKSAAIGLAKAGADIALLQRDVMNNSVKDEIQRLGVTCQVIQCDLENHEQVKQAVSKVTSAFGKLDILVNSAGIQRRAEATEFAEKDWNDVISVNLTSVWLLSQQAGKHMVERGSGKIINLASLLSFQGGITVPAYAASKGGVAQLTKALANEWAKHNVNVNGIVPGYIATDMNEAILNNPERNQQIIDRIPAGRWGKPEDFEGAVIFLASEGSNYVHGHLLAVDGGWMGR